MTTVPKPAAVSTWDSNSTNLVAPMAGHKTDGFATNEIPTSAEMNGQLNLFYQWDNFLNALATNGGNAVGQLDLGYPTESPTATASPATQTFTANDTTQACTATAHGLVTGEGPVRVSNAGGGLPGGLSAGVDYWVTSYDPNTFTLATSLANALNGNVVTLTTNGTGTQTLTAGASPTKPAPTPLVNFRDWNQSIRCKIDRLGYPSGSYSDWQEHWRQTTTTPPDGWTYAVTGAGTATATTPTGYLLERYLALQAGASNGNSIAVSCNPVGFLSSASALAMDWEMMPLTYTGHDGTMSFGLVIGSGAVYFSCQPSTTQWSYQISGSVDSYSGFAPGTYGVNASARFRIEILGPSNSTAGAGLYEYRMYINGVLVALAHDATTAAAFYPKFVVTSGSGGQADTMAIGRVRIQFNHFLSGDNV